MAKITEDYVSFETAKLLKENGFDEYTAMVYNQNRSFMPNGAIEDTYQTFYSAPTHQMAMKWLREVHNIAIVITPSMFWGKYNTSIYKKGNNYPYGFDGDSLVSSYEKAAEVAIKNCIEHFI